VMAIPFSLAMGAPVSAVLLDVNWLGLAHGSGCSSWKAFLAIPSPR